MRATGAAAAAAGVSHGDRPHRGRLAAPAARRESAGGGAHGRAALGALALAGSAAAGALLALLPVLTALTVGAATLVLGPRCGSRSWCAFTFAQLLAAGGWACSLLLAETVPQGFGHALLLAAHVLLLAGLLMLGGLRRHSDRVAAVDTAALAVALGVLRGRSSILSWTDRSWQDRPGDSCWPTRRSTCCSSPSRSASS